MYCDLFSITAAMDVGFHLSGSKNPNLTLQRNPTTIISNQFLRSGGGKLVGVNIEPTTTNTKIKPSLNINKSHNILGHAGEETLQATTKRLGWNLTQTFQPCKACAKAKAKMKDISQKTSSPATKTGLIIAVDISYVKKMSIGGCKFWLRAEDLFTKF